MKKLMTIAVLLCCAGLTGCMKSDDPVISPVSPGLNLYSGYGKPYSIYATDPMEIAIRLNTLLTEAQRLGITDLNAVSGESQNYTQLLFGNATLTRTGEGAAKSIEISYPEGYNYALAHDSKRMGKVIVHTYYGELLGGVETETYWSLSTETTNQYRLYSGTAPVMCDWTEYIITRNGNNLVASATLRLYETGKADNAANLEVNWTVKPYAVTDMSYANCYSKPWSVIEGSSVSGNPIGTNSTHNMIYRATTDLVYSSSGGCGHQTILSGTESVRYDKLAELYPERIPSGLVTVEWHIGTNCSGYAVMSYNGAEETFNY